MIYEYAFHLDMNHPDELAELFVDDCEVVYGPDFGAEGIEAYRKTLEGIGSFFEATSHHVSNIVVDFVSRGRGDACGPCCTPGTATRATVPTATCGASTTT